MKVLDNGYITLIESWGSDERIIESARMSTDKGFEGWGPYDNCTRCGHWKNEAFYEREPNDLASLFSCPDGKAHDYRGDEKLLRYLWENKHATPFEMAGAVVEVQAPIFVFREWHRHRTQSYNELSARYTALPDLFYTPSIDRFSAGGQASSNKQSSGGALPDHVVQWGRDLLGENYRRARKDYEDLLSAGVARELARLVIPVAQYSRMRASANLRNWLAFLTLREAPGAQWEIRQFANALHSTLAERFPRTLALFEEGQKQA